MNNFYADKQQIINWLDKHEVENYILVPDEKYGFVVNVNGNCSLCDKNLITIPIKFNNVNGNFYCYGNQLTSLEFCPQAISGSFFCNNNQLTSLEFCPPTVGGIFYCDKNQGLKEIQKMTDFELIFLEHKKILITKLSNKLNSDLPNDNSKKTAKIKI